MRCGTPCGFWAAHATWHARPLLPRNIKRSGTSVPPPQAYVSLRCTPAADNDHAPYISFKLRPIAKHDVAPLVALTVRNPFVLQDAPDPIDHMSGLGCFSLVLRQLRATFVRFQRCVFESRSGLEIAILTPCLVLHMRSQEPFLDRRASPFTFVDELHQTASDDNLIYAKVKNVHGVCPYPPD